MWIYRIQDTGMDKIHEPSLRFYEYLRTEILKHTLLPGQKLASENSYANVFGISRQTVRRMLNKLYRQGLIEKRPGIGTFVSAPGTLSTMPRTLNIALDLDECSPYSYHRKILSAFHALPPLYPSINFLFRPELFHEDIPLPDEIHSCLMVHGHEVSPSLVSRARKAGKNVLCFNRTCSDPYVGYVSINQSREVELLISRLLELGHRKILIIGSRDPISQARMEGGYQAWRNAGKIVPEHLMIQMNPVYPFFRNLEEILKEDVTAIFFTNSYVGQCFIQEYIRICGSLPEKYELFSFDDLRESRREDLPEYSYLEMPFALMAEMLVQYLIQKHMDPDVPPIRRFFDCHLVLSHRSYHCLSRQE